MNDKPDEIRATMAACVEDVLALTADKDPAGQAAFAREVLGIAYRQLLVADINVCGIAPQPEQIIEWRKAILVLFIAISGYSTATSRYLDARNPDE